MYELFQGGAVTIQSTTFQTFHLPKSAKHFNVQVSERGRTALTYTKISGDVSEKRFPFILLQENEQIADLVNEHVEIDYICSFFVREKLFFLFRELTNDR